LKCVIRGVCIPAYIPLIYTSMPPKETYNSFSQNCHNINVSYVIKIKMVYFIHILWAIKHYCLWKKNSQMFSVSSPRGMTDGDTGILNVICIITLNILPIIRVSLGYQHERSVECWGPTWLKSAFPSGFWVLFRKLNDILGCFEVLCICELETACGLCFISCAWQTEKDCDCLRVLFDPREGQCVLTQSMQKEDWKS
jgi:hypothetical protein